MAIILRTLNKSEVTQTVNQKLTKKMLNLLLTH